MLAELERWLAEHEPNAPRPGVVHRLDRETSDVLLFSIGPARHRPVVEGFRLRRIRKEYWALVVGWPSPRRGTITLPLTRNASGRTHQIRVHLTARGTRVLGDRRATPA